MKTLLLNSDYTPINVINSRRACVKALNGKVYVEKWHEKSFITASGRLVAVPSVVRLKSYINFNGFKDKKVVSKSDIFFRDQYMCGYCGKLLFKQKAATLDHIVPKSRGGAHTKNNLVTCCSPCNNKKGDRTPVEAKMPLLFPREHFRQNIQLLKVVESSNKFNEWKDYLL